MENWNLLSEKLISKGYCKNVDKITQQCASIYSILYSINNENIINKAIPQFFKGGN